MKKYGYEWKQRLKAGEFLLGGHLFLPNPSMAEAMVCFGYEYLWIDGEHGAYDKADILNHIIAVNGAGAGAFVRLVSGESSVIKPVLEMGPDGIIAPMINTAEQARGFISACTYPPKGSRGFGPRRANSYGVLSDREYLESVDGNLVKIIQIEHREGAENIGAILQIPGIDSVVIGPYDLSCSIDIPGQFRHPELLAMCTRIVECCKAHKIPCGPSIGPGDQEFLRFWLDQKTDFLFCGDDISFVKAGTETTISHIRTASGKHRNYSVSRGDAG
jgi:2-keto-3-deoxy-L-rhamnonate aldolase RhmA